MHGQFYGRLRFTFFIALFFYPKTKGTGQLATAGKGGGLDGVIQLLAKLDLEMVLDMAAAAKAVGDRQRFISSTEACALVMVKAFRRKTHQDFAIFLHPDTTPVNGNCFIGGPNSVFQRLILSGYRLRGF